MEVTPAVNTRRHVLIPSHGVRHNWSFSFRAGDRLRPASDILKVRAEPPPQLKVTGELCLPLLRLYLERANQSRDIQTNQWQASTACLPTNHRAYSFLSLALRSCKTQKEQIEDEFGEVNMRSLMDLFKYNVMTLNNINMIRGDDSPGDNSVQ